MGSPAMATSPAITTTMDSTLARTGRRMKMAEIMMFRWASRCPVR